MFFEPFYVRKIEFFLVIEKDHVKRTVILKKILILLNSGGMIYDLITGSCVLVNFESIFCELLVGIESVYYSFGVVCNE